MRNADRSCAKLWWMNEPIPHREANPFSPGFGKVPASIVGRDEVLSDLQSAFAVGPSDTRYATVIVGVRGSGKTVVLNAIQDHATSNGWVVLAMDGTESGLLDRISAAISRASTRYEALGAEAFPTPISKTRSSAVKVGPYTTERSEQRSANNGMDLRGQLTFLAEAAQQADVGVLLTVDELHAANHSEARRLAGDLQHIANRESLPLAFVGAGLMELRYTLMEGKRNTFFKRCNTYELPPLTEADAIRGLRAPIGLAGGQIDAPALRTAAQAVDGSPYKLQLIGHQAWVVSGAPDHTIDSFAVAEAIRLATETVTANVSEPAFYELADNEQRYLEAIAALDRPTPRRVATALRADPRVARRIIRRLDLSGYVARQHDYLVLTGLVPKSVILEATGGDWDFDTTDTFDGSTAENQLGSTATKCRKWMPRAAAYCVLAAGHAGGCRSHP